MSDSLDSALQSATVKIIDESVRGDGLIDAEEGAVDPGLNVMKTFFRFEGNPNKDQTQKLNEIYEWAKGEAESDDNFEVVKVLRDVRLRLGTTPIDVSYLNHFYQYVRLAQEARQIKGEMEALTS